MLQLFKSVAIGAVSGVVTYFLSLYALGYTNAFVKPLDFPLSLWLALVVFGIGASLVALVIHFIATRFLGAQVLPALAAFLATTLGLLAANNHLQHGTEVLGAWAVGAILASVVHHWLRPNNSFKPNLLRKSA